MPEVEDVQEGGTLTTMSQAAKDTSVKESEAEEFNREGTMDRLTKSQLGPLGFQHVMNTPEENVSPIKSRD